MPLIGKTMEKIEFGNLDGRIINAYKQFTDRSEFVPVGYEDGVIRFWAVNDNGIKKADFMALSLGLKPKVEIKAKKDLLMAMENIYDMLEEETAQNEEEKEDITDEENIIGASYTDAPIVKLVNQTIVKAVQQNASDIHFEGLRDNFVIRLRVDGALFDYKKYAKRIQEAVISRIKVMANLDVAETRRPQDGAIRVNVGTKSIDIRVSIVPSITGEKAALRILDTSNELLGLSDIGMDKEDIELFLSKLKYPNGIILVTGPTGSGKTTTLYAALKAVATRDKHIITIEDPIEYRIDGITQVQVNPKLDLTFANALKYFLRQDPDIVLVGEIRDSETAKTAIAASLTGHLVLSTVHTNDAATTLARLIDMGIEPFLLASSLLLVIGQRLVRKVCDNCKTRVQTPAQIREILRQYGEDVEFYEQGRGCEACKNSGFSGRVGIFELLDIKEEIKRMIIKKADAKAIRETAVKNGMKTMLTDGMQKVRNGITTPEEVLLATRL